MIKRHAKMLSLLGAGVLAVATAAVGTAAATPPTTLGLTSVPTANTRSAATR